jgi:small conductance mechanosensitive channel
VTDPELLDACGTNPSIVCRSTWNWWHNKFVSQLSEWLIAKPLAAGCVIIGAALVTRYLRKASSTVITRITTSNELAALVRAQNYGEASTFDARQKSRAATLSAVSGTTISAVVWAIALLIIFQIFGVAVGPLLAGAGIAGIALGFGSQSLVKDCIAGFFMLLEDQCGVGDEVNLQVCVGTVEDLTLRVTRVRGYDGTLWTIPNGTIQSVGNLSRNWAQGNIDITVWHSSDVDRAIEAIQAAADETAALPEIAEQLVQPPTLAGVERVEATGTTIRLQVRTKAGKQWPVLRQFRLAVKRHLDQAGVPLHPPYDRRPPS